MHNAEFFNHQLRQQIDERISSEQFAQSSRPLAKPGGRSAVSLWTGATSLAIFAVCTFFVMREKPSTGQSPYLTQILSARVDPRSVPMRRSRCSNRRKTKPRCCG